ESGVRWSDGDAQYDEPLVLRLRRPRRGLRGAERPRDWARHAGAGDVEGLRARPADEGGVVRQRARRRQHLSPSTWPLLCEVRRLALSDDRPGRGTMGPLQPRTDRRDD